VEVGAEGCDLEKGALLLGWGRRTMDNEMRSVDPEPRKVGRWEGQRGPGSGPGMAVGLPAGGAVSF
jgi:hypothetical protein